MIRHLFADSALWWGLFITLEWAIRIVAVVVVPFRRSPDVAKGWLLLILFEPVVGSALYLWFGRTRLPEWRRQRAAAFEEVARPVYERLRRQPNVFQPEQAPGDEAAVRLTEKLGELPILGGNAVEVLTDYGEILDRLIADIDAAQSHVHLLFYIVANDPVAGRVMAALERAARRGVRCRLLADALGSRAVGFEAVQEKLVSAGVEAKATLRVAFLRVKEGRVDLRNHRKIAVIDGRIGYTGSLNLVDPNFKKGLTYEELMVRVRGPIVLELQAVFAQDWYQETGLTLEPGTPFPDPEVVGAVGAQVLPSSPLYKRQNSQRLIVALLGMARERAVITTPYFIPDDALRQALTTAVMRGVEVTLVVPEQDDQLFVSNAQKSYYAELLGGGVRICRYGARFLHAKHATIDDRIAWIGSSNMDIRSFALNAEVVLLAYDAEVCRALRGVQERYFAAGTWLNTTEWNGQPMWRQVGWNLARLFSSVL